MAIKKEIQKYMTNNSYNTARHYSFTDSFYAVCRKKWIHRQL